MDWKKIQVFVKVSKYESFTKASVSLKKSQSTLSRDVIKLEKQSGYSVFKRNIRGIKLTEKGKKLLIIGQNFQKNLLDI